MKNQITIPCTEYSIQADWYEESGSHDTILTFVGFGSNKNNNSDFVAKLVEMTDFNALVVDLSGHGNSPFDINDTSPAQHLLEATKAYDWIKATYPGHAIYVMGTSYGGFIAAYLSRFRAIQKLILRTPAIYKPEDLYNNHKDIDKLLVRAYRKDFEAVQRHPLFQQASFTDISTLLIVHGDDESVPVETTDAYKNAFAAQTYLAEGFTHSFRNPSNPQKEIDKYYSVIANWL
jgi:uncharacterized protein